MVVESHSESNSVYFSQKCPITVVSMVWCSIQLPLVVVVSHCYSSFYGLM